VKILFRVDARPDVGLGHLIRSIAIARRLKDHYLGTEICFLTRENQFSIDLLIKNDFPYKLRGTNPEESFICESVRKADADVLFIDNLFPYPPEFIREIRRYIRVSMFHNLCDGAFDCDQFILPASHVSDIVLQDKRWLTGPVKLYEGFPYIVLNDKILVLERKSGINTDPMNIVLTTGGSDPKGVMIRLLEFLMDFKIENIKITSLIGETFSHPGELEKFRGRFSSIFSVHPFNYTDLANADLAVNTFGVGTYELIYLGIPVLSIGHAEQNAQGSARLAEKYGIINNLGLIDNLTRQKFLSALIEMIAKPKQLMKIQKKSRQLIDGLGCVRVADLIYSLGAA